MQRRQLTDSIEDPHQLEREIERANRLAAGVTEQTTYQRLKQFVEELRQRLQDRLATRRAKEMIRTRAKELWELSGRPPGRDLEFWLTGGTRSAVRRSRLLESVARRPIGGRTPPRKTAPACSEGAPGPPTWSSRFGGWGLIRPGASSRSPATLQSSSHCEIFPPCVSVRPSGSGIAPREFVSVAGGRIQYLRSDPLGQPAGGRTATMAYVGKFLPSPPKIPAIA
jgi:Protein of unknown function (DUF2934)